MNQFFTVRAEDIDGNAHVNNAVYVGYFDEVARGHLLAEGFGFFDFGSGPFLRTAEYTYDSPLFFGEIINVGSDLEDRGSGGIFLNQEMVCSGERVSRARLEYGLVRRNGGKNQDPAGCVREFERQRLAFVESNRLGPQALRELGVGLYVRSAHYAFLSPFLIENPEVAGTLSYEKGVRALFKQTMSSGGGEVARADLVYAFVDLKTRKPTRPPAGVLGNLKNS